jgi:hypothetical protein
LHGEVDIAQHVHVTKPFVDAAELDDGLAHDMGLDVGM